MSNDVAMSFEDGVTKVISVGAYETIMDAAYKARINIPSDCRDGACGTCKSLCISGEFDPGDYIDDAMTDDELERGYVLPCQALPESDMVIEVPGTSEMAKTSAGRYRARVINVERHSDSTVSFSLDVEDRSSLGFLPGQYMNVTVPGTEEVRSYSFSNGPKVEEASFMVRTAAPGVMSDYLRERAVEGDTLTMTGPYGSFFLRTPQRRVLMLAGGTGLAPILSMLEKLADSPTDHPVHLVYGITRDDDLVGVEQLDDYVDRLQNFSYSYCVADPESNAEQIGYVTSFVEDEHLAEGDVDVYLCGPPPMVGAVSTWLDDRPFDVTNFYYEKFAADASGGSKKGAVSSAGAAA